MKKIIVLFTILFVVFHAFAQEKISGYVEDSLTHNRLTNVSVTLLRNGKPLKFTRSKGDGTFLIPIAQKQTGDMLQASYMGYKKQKTAVSSGKETIISMASTAFVLKEVQVKGSRITGRDTISFDLTRFANERDNSLKDVLKKLPGVDIEKNGRINYNGKPINRFTVEGLDLTGGKYNQLEENIKAKDPGLTPDLLSVLLVVATQARGSVLFHQKMFESRLFFVDKLIDMGAQIILCDPHRAVVVGHDHKIRLRAGRMTSPDIRAGIALLIAAMSANGTSRIENIAQIDRGYEDIEFRLNQLGAKITRVTD